VTSVPAAQYRRVSTEREEYSLDCQSARIASYAKENGFVVRQTNCDEAEGGLEIGPGQKVEFKSGGYHIMFMDLRSPFKQGDKLKGQLRFEKAGTVDVEFKVESIGAGAPAAPKHSH